MKNSQKYVPQIWQAQLGWKIMSDDNQKRRMAEIDEIKREHFEAMKPREVVLLVKHDYGWSVGHWLPDGVAPTTAYDTPQEAAARTLQLLNIKEPVTPQDWPEIAQIGGPPSPPPRPAR